MKIRKTLLFALFISFFKIYALTPEQLADSVNANAMVYFDINKYELKQEALPVLDSLAAQMLTDTNLALIISGHADSIGSYEHNLSLSRNRAEKVKNYLISKGCNASRINTEAMSFTRPKLSNNSEYNRSLNRRVEFTWVKTKGVKQPEINANGIFTTITRDTLNMDMAIIDKDSTMFRELKEEDITANLKWEKDNQENTTEGKIRLIPIDDKKKIAVTLLMDYSPSMWDDSFERNTPKTERILAMEYAVKTFVDNCDNRIYSKITKFGGTIDEITKFTGNTQFLKSAVETRSYPRNATALFKAIHNDLLKNPYIKNPAVMKTVIAFTDGEDNSSGNITVDAVTSQANSLGIRVYTIGLFHRSMHTDPPGENNKAELDLYNIAKQTGGFYYYSPDGNTLVNIYNRIFDNILNSFNISIVWNKDTLPPKGTKVKAIVKVKIRNDVKKFEKDYVME